MIWFVSRFKMIRNIILIGRYFDNGEQVVAGDPCGDYKPHM